MNRITIKQATQAYRSIGAMPGRGAWGDRKTCCPLMACSLAAGRNPVGGDQVAVVLNLSLNYVAGYVTGFDGLEVKGRLPFDSQAGLDDGRAAAAALLG